MATNEKLPPRINRLSLAMMLCGIAFPNPTPPVRPIQPPRPNQPIVTWTEPVDPREQLLEERLKHAWDII